MNALCSIVLVALLAAVVPANAQYTGDVSINTPVSLGQWTEGPLMVRQGTSQFVAWTSSASIVLQHVDSGGFTAPADELVAFGETPAMASDGAGGVVIAWELVGRIYVQRYDATLTPQWPVGGLAVAAGGGDQSMPTLVDDGASVVIAWLDESAGVRSVRAQKLALSGARQWPPLSTGVEVTVATGAVGHVAPALAATGGGAFVGWQTGAGQGSDVFVRHIEPLGGGGWPVEVAVAAGPGWQGAVQLVSDFAGGAVVTWRDHTGGPDLRAQRFDAQGFALWQPATGVALSSTLSGDYTLGRGAAGGAVVAWSRNAAIRFQELRADGSRRWGTTGLQLSPSGTSTGGHVEPDLKGDGFGAAVVAWNSDSRIDDEVGDVYAQFVSPLVGPSWDAGGSVVSSAPGLQDHVAVTGPGHCPSWFSFSDARPARGIYIQRFLCPGFPGKVGWLPLVVGTQTLSQGETGRVAVVIGPLGGQDLHVDGGDFTVVWDDTVFEIVDVVSGEGMDEMEWSITARRDGELDVQATGDGPAIEGATLFELIVQAVDIGSSALSIPRATVGDLAVQPGAAVVTVTGGDP